MKFFLLTITMIVTGRSFSQEFTPQEIKFYDKVFTQVDSVLNIDKGKMWGQSLRGPLLLVNPENREFFTNENNTRNEFLFVGNVWHGILEPEIGIANTAIDWAGKRWSMVMLPLPNDEMHRNNLLVHESFHRVQPSLGFTKTQELGTAHLDSFDGRLLLRLELDALRQALKSKRGDAWLEHVKNALTFRWQRHQIKGAKASENSLELNEGMAQYTANKLSIPYDETIPYLIERSENLLNQASFLRGFAYELVPIYGFILSHEKPNWHREIDNNTNLSDYFYENFEFDKTSENSWETIAKYGYGLGAKKKLERRRERKLEREVANQMYWYHTKPTLKLPFQNMNISFDYTNLITLKDIGTIYPRFEIKDEWGILKVTKGGLILKDWSSVIVSNPRVFRSDKISGRGWVLDLNPGWDVRQKGSRFWIEKKRYLSESVHRQKQ